MAKKMLIDATHAEETRVVVVDGNKVEEFDFETLNKRQLAGNIYLAKVTRVEPSLQAAFVDYGGNRHGFLAFAEIHPDYYQIPVADRRALLEEERAAAREEEEEENHRSSRRRKSGSPRPERAAADPVVSGDVRGSDQPGTGAMDVIDLSDDAAQAPEGAVDALGAPFGGEAAAEAIAAPVEAAVAPAEVDAEAAAEAAEAPSAAGPEDHAEDTSGEAAADAADEIESIADEDVAEEISAPRRPRARRYKIQEVIKVRQIMLVQVVKEERGNKGAALTTYLSLAGRYCVLMPNTARGGGISRKITVAADRKKLKEIAGELEVPEGAGLIIRTAGAKRTKPEIRRDYEYLMRLWEQIRDLTLRSVAPAAIYEEGDLIKRTIRDLYSREIEEVLVEGEAGYRTAKDFMRMIMPAHARQVKRYDEPMPLFARFQVESYLGGMFNPVVQLKSGGYIVIGITEALVAIDVNSGRATKEGSIEDTALKTNLEACDEVARQLRLRDLAGLIVIDFIDMEERKNNAAVEKRLKDKLKTDRARIQIGRISGFGLMEMSRQRLRPGMLESTTQPCAHCHGTGLIRSDDSMALTILRALEEEGTRKRSKEVLLKAPVSIINYLFNHKREHIALIEARYGMAVRMEADPSLISPDYSIEKFKTATRALPEPGTVISGHAGLMGAPVAEDEDEDLIDEAFEEEIEEAEEVVEAAEAGETQAERAEAGDPNGDGGKKRRRRRRRRRGGSRDEQGAETSAEDDGDEGEEGEDEAAEASAETAVAPVGAEPVADAPVAAEPAEAPEAGAAPKRRRAPRSRKGAVKAEELAASPVSAAEDVAVEAVAPEAATEAAPAAAAAPVVAEAVEAPEAVPAAAAEPPAKKPAARRSRAKAKPAVTAEAEAAAEPAEKPVKPKATRSRAKKVTAAEPGAETAAAAVVSETAPVAGTPAAAPAPVAAPAKEVAAQEAPAQEAAVPAAEADSAESNAPRRKGWWSAGR
ncbi:Rne/Rng family ribonuclease [Pseudogemmobacter faecipullorum]|uniref:Ribonuclease E n=1 Tax=Pseudogemmobacter faecipullorum TaxID=2755041 RepID=A0ABS8CLF1_9RHOB|nr:ribonuclease E/G [Pseudogemmobacter faecipullorum]MCB5410207.1 ribonuclease E/G [Pseudogemmobacter faecipullorum]